MTNCSDNRKTILIVFDSAANLELLERVLRNEFRVIEAKSGREAMHKLCSSAPVSMIIFDVSKSNHDDFITLKAMRRENLLCRIPAIVVKERNDIEGQIMALDCGAEDVFSRPFDSRMVLHRVRNIIERRETAKKIEKVSLYEQLLKQQDKFLQAARIDQKTGIYNRRAFCRRVSTMLRENPDREYVIFHWDIDRFKVFNDVYGIAAGDAFLAAVGEIYRSIQDDSFAYGYCGADDFVNCVERSMFDPEKVLYVITKLISTIHSEFGFVARLGAYVVDDPSLDVELMCDRAKIALRSTKNGYTKPYAYYEDTMRAKLIEEQEIIGEMRNALHDGQFAVYFQPQYNHYNGDLYGAEALVRWMHPRKGLISPGKFIPAFERNGFIAELDKYVWDRTCAYIRRWLDSGIDVPPISVNISRCDIYNPKLCDHLVELVMKYNLDPSYLRLEITETVYMENPNQLISLVDRLRENGFFVEMDDFGSGYSSLNMLKDVPVDLLKLDMKFIGKDFIDTRGGTILSSVIRMAHWIKIPVIAEGVETKVQADYLKSLGCLLMQGYYFAKPMPADAFEVLLRYDCTSPNYKETKWSAGLGSATQYFSISTKAAPLFNSFEGGAAIVEYYGNNVEAVRLNDKFFELMGITRGEYADEKLDFLEWFDGESRKKILNMLERTIHTEFEAECEVPVNSKKTGNSYIRIKGHHLAETAGRHALFLTLETVARRGELPGKSSQPAE